MYNFIVLLTGQKSVFRGALKVNLPIVSEEKSENILIRRIAKGDAYAFEEIYKKYNKKIYSFSLRYLKNKEDAEGVVQEVFLSFWQNSKRMRKDSNLNAYLFTLTFNAIRKKFRKLQTEKKYLNDYNTITVLENKDELTEVEYFDQLEKVNQLIEKLPPQQKKIFQLHKNKGLTNLEIADQLQISKKTVENHLYKARSFLKKVITDQGLLTFLFYWLFIK